MPVVYLPSMLREMAGGQESVIVAGGTVRQVIDQLESAYPGIKQRLCAGEQLKPNLALVVDGAAQPRNLDLPVQPGAEIHFVSVIRGG